VGPGLRSAILHEATVTYRDYVGDLLDPFGDVTIRAMFGGHGIFESGDMFALISSEERLYFKADDSNRADYEAAGAERFQTMPYYEVPEEVIEDPGALAEWAATSIAIGHATASRKKGR